MRSNSEYKNEALSRLKGDWSPSVVATVIYLLVAVVVAGSNTPAIIKPDSLGLAGGLMGGMFLLSVFIAGPLEVAFSNSFKDYYLFNDRGIAANMWNKFTDNYLHKVVGMLLMGIKVCLWTLLFFIPGIVMSFAYAMTPYILEDNPELSAWEASTRSREIMKGHKFDLFYLYLSFIGWAILSILTFWIGFIWLIPYMQLAEVSFYNDITGGSPVADAPEASAE